MRRWLWGFGVLRIAIGLFMVAAMVLHWTQWGIQPADPRYVDFGGLKMLQVSWRMLIWLAPSILQGVFHLMIGIGIVRKRLWVERLMRLGWIVVWGGIAFESVVFGTYRSVFLWLRDVFGVMLLMVCDFGFVRPMLREMRHG